MSAQKVVTHSYTDGTEYSVCADHAEEVPSYSASGASYAGVSHGLHRGHCDACELVTAATEVQS